MEKTQKKIDETTPEKTPEAQPSKQPFAKIKVGGGMQVVFWERETQRGEQKITVLQPSITQSWRDKDGTWQNRSVNVGSMPRLYELLATSGEIRAVHQRFREGLRNVAAPEAASVDDFEE